MKLNDEGKGLVESFGELGREREGQRQGKEKPVRSYFSWGRPAFQDSERTWSEVMVLPWTKPFVCSSSAYDGSDSMS